MSNRRVVIALAAGLFLCSCDGGQNDVDAPSEPMPATPHETTAITVRLSSPPANGVLFFQDGDGTWQEAPAPMAENTYQFDVHWSRYAVGWTCLQEATTAYGGAALYSAAFDYRLTDEAQQLTEQVLCHYDEPTTDLVNWSCLEDGRVHSEWQPTAGATRYELTIAENTNGGCFSGTHVSCLTDWHVSLPVEILGVQPQFDPPPLKPLPRFPEQIPYGCEVRQLRPLEFALRATSVP